MLVPWHRHSQHDAWPTWSRGTIPHAHSLPYSNAGKGNWEQYAN
jgi:hypothetical protein